MTQSKKFKIEKIDDKNEFECRKKIKNKSNLLKKRKKQLIHENRDNNSDKIVKFYNINILCLLSSSLNDG